MAQHRAGRQLARDAEDARQARLAAQAPAGAKPRDGATLYTAEEVDAFMAGQASMRGRVARTRDRPDSRELSAESFGYGKGKRPYEPMAAVGKGKKGKKVYEQRDPMPCSQCGHFYVCAKVAAGKGLDAHCTNPNCDRSREFLLLPPEQQKLLLEAKLAAKRSAAAEAAVAAAEAQVAERLWAAQQAALRGAGAPGTPTEPILVEDSQFSPLTPAGAPAAAAHSDTDVSQPSPGDGSRQEGLGTASKAKGPGPAGPLTWLAQTAPEAPAAAAAEGVPIPVYPRCPYSGIRRPRQRPSLHCFPGVPRAAPDGR